MFCPIFSGLFWNPVYRGTKLGCLKNKIQFDEIANLIKYLLAKSQNLNPVSLNTGVKRVTTLTILGNACSHL